MRGKVIAYSEIEGRGLISGDDGQRYGFGRAVLGSGGHARPGQEVDFQASGSEATSVYVLGGGAGPAQKSKVAAGVLAILLGGLGIHKFYIGAPGAGVIMLLCTFLGWVLLFIPTLIVWLISIIEGIIYLTKSDEDFYETYEVGKKGWF